ncbi:uncharacterized protein BDZ99DRAFT_466553 [Mytilinidion resinicola]|uniref:F-box domain-containing protein n=1 Tax=Mytilinidion resinicola TaxID=574789 RepID=A0A6A6YBX4_9PEZI|nr:uncharacterized protein BDZ99DRAFT_466553 [Mytilinidion resinicola]KAF2805595.1 hypothetical protein BDZ99DRAFT_466553 [Mytilinidion resinicola]
MAPGQSSEVIPDQCYLYNLPNEIILHILTPLPTLELLPLTLISHRIYALILRILHNRLYLASQLHDHTLMLECYHPSAKLTEPPYFCTYHGTEGLSLYYCPSETDVDLPARLGELKNLYSHFRPHRREIEPARRRVNRHPAGDVPGSRTHSESSSTGAARRADKDDMVKQILGLESHELFTQLCAVGYIVRNGPRPGIFMAYTEVEEGVVRVWREWLGKMSKRGKGENAAGRLAAAEEGDAGQNYTVTAPGLDEENLLWVSPAKNTGIRFNIRDRKLRREVPILLHVEEDLPVSYEVEYDELLIRTSHLLLMFEKSLLQRDNSSGKAVVIGSFG